MARVKPEELRNADENNLENQAKQYTFLKKQKEYMEKQMSELRETIFEALDESGEIDSKGNVVIEFETEVEGFGSVMKQRRVTRKINESVAEEMITAKGLEDKLYKTIRVVDEDALMAALYSDELTEEEIDEMYPQNVVWALVMNKR
jgi:hypothetical protein